MQIATDKDSSLLCCNVGDKENIVQSYTSRQCYKALFNRHWHSEKIASLSFAAYSDIYEEDAHLSGAVSQRLILLTSIKFV